MAKNKVSEWSSTPANNTDIANIDIAEGCAPSGVNNAIREVMAQVKDMQTGADGDNFTVGGNLSVTGTSAFTGAITASGGVSGNVTGNLTGNVTGNCSGTSLNVTGVVAVANGGTGLSTLTANNVLLGNGTSSPSFVAPGTANNSLKSNGTTWISDPGITSTSGTAPYYGARAFVTFDGTGTDGTNMTLLSSGNVSSVYKNSVGDYTVNFTTALPSANYAMSGSSKFYNAPNPNNEGTGASVSFSGYTPPTTSACRVWNVWLNESTGAINVVQPADTDRISLVFFI